MNDTLQNNLIAYFLIALLVFIMAVFTILIVLRYRREGQGYYLEKQRMHYEWQQHLLNAQLEIQEQTFKTISQEIHDNIGQALSVANLHLDTINWTQIKEAEVSVEEASELLMQGIQDLRDLSKTLHTGWIVDLGWIKALEVELKRVKKSGFEVVLEADEFDIVALSGSSQLMLFRIIQEVLQNIVKHAHASRIAMYVSQQQQHIAVTIADNGTGFDSNAVAQGTGLRNVREHAAILQAELTITSKQNAGTTVHIHVPTNQMEWQK